MECPKCGKEMENLGNIDQRVYCTHPPQWDETYVCHYCKIKTKIRMHQEIPFRSNDIDNYKEIKDE